MQEVKLQFDQNIDFRMKEAFKTLRSNVEFCGSDVKVVAITSCTPHEGKSSIAMEMAKAFAEAGNRTLLIDADMRKSVLVGRYKTGAVRYGLSHCLIGRYKYTDVICQTNIPHLYMIFSGPVPPNPSELLGSERFSAMLNALKSPFDYVIIDTPPLGSVIDAAVVAKSCDGTVLVVENNAVSYRFVQRVKEQLDKSGSRILGVVLNKVDMNSKGYYGHYGRYYGKYYGEYYGKYGSDTRTIEKEKQEKKTVSTSIF
ncbi:MAG: polysaccharide biosynthesis tyrosine autokinase [Lachnospiraceae bacterium]|nr:polysaccharide biosynthesis tyrosine autokinase [Lachnospiraceae bacterium]